MLRHWGLAFSEFRSRYGRLACIRVNAGGKGGGGAVLGWEWLIADMHQQRG